jgi:hypothetical protein
MRGRERTETLECCRPMMVPAGHPLATLAGAGYRGRPRGLATTWAAVIILRLRCGGIEAALVWVPACHGEVEALCSGLLFPVTHCSDLKTSHPEWDSPATHSASLPVSSTPNQRFSPSNLPTSRPSSFPFSRQPWILVCHFHCGPGYSSRGVSSLVLTLVVNFSFLCPADCSSVETTTLQGAAIAPERSPPALHGD